MSESLFSEKNIVLVNAHGDIEDIEDLEILDTSLAFNSLTKDDLNSSSDTDKNLNTFSEENKPSSSSDHFDELISKLAETQPIPTPVGSNTAFATIPKILWIKLFGFTFMLFLLPLVSYFAGIYYFFPGNLLISAMLSIIMANVVVAMFIYAAYTESTEGEKQKTE